VTAHSDRCCIDYSLCIARGERVERRNVDAKRFNDVTSFLQIQHYEARWWRDACLTYFMSVNKLTMPSGFAAPQQSYSYYQTLTGSSSCPADATKPRCSAIYTGNPSPAITTAP